MSRQLLSYEEARWLAAEMGNLGITLQGGGRAADAAAPLAVACGASAAAIVMSAAIGASHSVRLLASVEIIWTSAAVRFNLHRLLRTSMSSTIRWVGCIGVICDAVTHMYACVSCVHTCMPDQTVDIGISDGFCGRICKYDARMCRVQPTQCGWQNQPFAFCNAPCSAQSNLEH